MDVEAADGEKRILDDSGEGVGEEHDPRLRRDDRGIFQVDAHKIVYILWFDDRRPAQKVLPHIGRLVEEPLLAVVRERPPVEIVQPGQPLDPVAVQRLGEAAEPVGGGHHPLHMPQAGEHRQPGVDLLAVGGDEAGDMTQPTDAPAEIDGQLASLHAHSVRPHARPLSSRLRGPVRALSCHLLRQARCQATDRADTT